MSLLSCFGFPKPVWSKGASGGGRAVPWVWEVQKQNVQDSSGPHSGLQGNTLVLP